MAIDIIRHTLTEDELAKIGMYRDSIVDTVITSAPRPIKFKLFLTGEEVLIEDIKFLGRSDHRTSKPVVISKKEFRHPNLLRNENIPNKIARLVLGVSPDENLFTYDFCNDVVQGHLLDNPQAATLGLTVNLEAPNYGSGYREPSDFLKTSVAFDKQDKAIFCTECGTFIKNSEIRISLINKICPSCLVKQPEKITALETTGYYVKSPNKYSYHHVKLKPKTTTVFSEYYPSLQASEIPPEEIQIPIVEQDMLVIGLGSAGTGILDQIGRTKLISSITLLDFDSVEDKNLRNQWYTKAQTHSSKVFASNENLAKMRVESLKTKTIEDRFKKEFFKYSKYKYVVLGLDSIKVRQEVFDAIVSGYLKTDYIIDTRYDNLESSIYFIDTKDETQMDYFKTSLILDATNLTEEEPVLVEERDPSLPSVQEIIDDNNLFRSGCQTVNFKYLLNSDSSHPRRGNNICRDVDDRGLFPWAGRCGSDECREYCINALTKAGLRITRKSTEPISTCLNYNIIDIYKFTSSFITATIRSIVAEQPKLFTHIEATTDPLPTAMKVKA